MRDQFRSGTAFLIVAAVCFIASALVVVKRLMTDNGSMGIPIICFVNALLWFNMGMAFRRKYKAEHKPGSES